MTGDRADPSLAGETDGRRGRMLHRELSRPSSNPAQSFEPTESRFA